jgi:restriction system protein
MLFVAYRGLSAIQAKVQARCDHKRDVLHFRWPESITPREFEQHCADYLSLRGWQAHATKYSGDQGADVIAKKSGIVVVLQCKKYTKPVSNKAVQEVYAARAFVGAAKAAVVSNQSYTESARLLAKKTGVLLLHYTDLERLDSLISLNSTSNI